MLFRESELTSAINTRSIFDEAYDLLSEATYLTEDESFLSPVAVPIVENSRLGIPVVNFSDVSRLSEENGIDYGCAVMAIAESNGISDVCVAVTESDIILNPDLVYEMDNIVISEMPDSHVVYQYTEACLDTWLESGDMNFLVDYIEDTYLTEASKMQYKDRTGKSFAELMGEINKSNKINKKEKEKRRQELIKTAEDWASKENTKEKGLVGKGKTKFETDNLDVTVGTDRTKNGFTDKQLKQMRNASNAESDELRKDRNGNLEAEERERHENTRKLKNSMKQNAYDYQIRKDLVMGKRNATLAARAARDAAAKKEQNATGVSAGAEETKVKESESYLNKIKDMCWNKPKKFIADKIAAIRKWAHNVQNSTESGIWMKIKKIVAKVITTLEGWLAKAPAQAENSTADAAEA